MVKAAVRKVGYNIIKDQLRKVCTNNAGGVLPKSDRNEEKNKVEASNDVYYARENSKLS